MVSNISMRNNKQLKKMLVKLQVIYFKIYLTNFYSNSLSLNYIIQNLYNFILQFDTAKGSMSVNFSSRHLFQKVSLPLINLHKKVNPVLRDQMRLILFSSKYLKLVAMYLTI